jgi:hypothetical protein
MTTQRREDHAGDRVERLQFISGYRTIRDADRRQQAVDAIDEPQEWFFKPEHPMDQAAYVIAADHAPTVTVSTKTTKEVTTLGGRGDTGLNALYNIAQRGGTVTYHDTTAAGKMYGLLMTTVDACLDRVTKRTVHTIAEAVGAMEALGLRDNTTLRHRIHEASDDDRLTGVLAAHELRAYDSRNL